MAKIGYAAHLTKKEVKKIEYYQLVLMPSCLVFGDFDSEREAWDYHNNNEIPYAPEDFIIYPVYEGQDGYSEYA